VEPGTSRAHPRSVLGRVVDQVRIGDLGRRLTPRPGNPGIGYRAAVGGRAEQDSMPEPASQRAAETGWARRDSERVGQGTGLPWRLIGICALVVTSGVHQPRYQRLVHGAAEREEGYARTQRSRGHVRFLLAPDRPRCDLPAGAVVKP